MLTDRPGCIVESAWAGRGVANRVPEVSQEERSQKWVGKFSRTESDPVPLQGLGPKALKDPLRPSLGRRACRKITQLRADERLRFWDLRPQRWGGWGLQN